MRRDGRYQFQRARLAIGAVMFFILFGFVRNIILDHPLDSRSAMIGTIIFVIWLGFSDFLTNFVMSVKFETAEPTDGGDVQIPTADCPT